MELQLNTAADVGNYSDQLGHAMSDRHCCLPQNFNNTSQYDPAYAGSGEIRM